MTKHLRHPGQTKREKGQVGCCNMRVIVRLIAPALPVLDDLSTWPRPVSRPFHGLTFSMCKTPDKRNAIRTIISSPRTSEARSGAYTSLILVYPRTATRKISAAPKGLKFE